MLDGARRTRRSRFGAKPREPLRRTRSAPRAPPAGVDAAAGRRRRAALPARRDGRASSPPPPPRSRACWRRPTRRGHARRRRRRAPLAAGDIAVLVRSNAQGTRDPAGADGARRRQRRAVAGERVPQQSTPRSSIACSRRSLEPARERTLRAALATELLGCDAAAHRGAGRRRVRAAGRASQRFAGYREIWLQRGVGVMLRQWLAAEQVGRPAAGAARRRTPPDQPAAPGRVPARGRRDATPRPTRCCAGSSAARAPRGRRRHAAAARVRPQPGADRHDPQVQGPRVPDRVLPVPVGRVARRPRRRARRASRITTSDGQRGDRLSATTAATTSPQKAIKRRLQARGIGRDAAPGLRRADARGAPLRDRRRLLPHEAGRTAQSPTGSTRSLLNWLVAGAGLTPQRMVRAARTAPARSPPPGRRWPSAAAAPSASRRCPRPRGDDRRRAARRPTRWPRCRRRAAIAGGLADRQLQRPRARRGARDRRAVDHDLRASTPLPPATARGRGARRRRRAALPARPGRRRMPCTALFETHRFHRPLRLARRDRQALRCCTRRACPARRRRQRARCAHACSRRLLDDVMQTATAARHPLLRPAPAAAPPDRTRVPPAGTPPDGAGAEPHAAIAHGYPVPRLTFGRAATAFSRASSIWCSNTHGRFYILDWKSNHLGTTPADYSGEARRRGDGRTGLPPAAAAVLRRARPLPAAPPAGLPLRAPLRRRVVPVRARRAAAIGATPTARPPASFSTAPRPRRCAACTRCSTRRSGATRRHRARDEPADEHPPATRPRADHGAWTPGGLAGRDHARRTHHDPVRHPGRTACRGLLAPCPTLGRRARRCGGSGPARRRSGATAQPGDSRGPCLHRGERARRLGAMRLPMPRRRAACCSNPASSARPKTPRRSH